MYNVIQLYEFGPAWGNRRRKTVIYFLGAVSVYLLLLSLNYFHRSEAVKSLANAFAFSIFVGFLLKALLQPTLPRLRTQYVAAFTLIIVGMLCNFVMNYGATDLADYLKMVLSPLFFFIGYSSLSFREFRGDSHTKLLFFSAIILIIPSSIALGEIAVWGEQFKGYGETSISIFANRNNAALYAIVLSILFVMLGIHRRWVLLYLILVSALFGTIGVLLAVGLSIVILQIRKGKIGNLALFSLFFVFAFLLASAIPGLAVFERLSSLMQGLSYLYSSGAISHMTQMNYGDLSQIMGSSDVSFFFRLTHWTELLDIYRHGSLSAMLFGHGVGSSVRESSAELVPHNDYLRYLFECGILPFTGFLLLNLRIVKDIGSTYIAIPFITIIIYFFSENLINNFLAMMLFYFLAGFIIARSTAVAKQRP